MNNYFIDSAIDDFGLTPHEFRIYCRICRAIANFGCCRESATSMAQSCGMDVKTVRKSIHNLASYGLVSVTQKPGKTPYIFVAPAIQVPDLKAKLKA